MSARQLREEVLNLITAVVVMVMVCVVATDNLAIGVAVGSVTAMVIFAKRVAHLANVTDPDGTTVAYSVTGELFFASSNDLVGQFNDATHPDKVVIDLSAAHIWDGSSVAALDAIETKCTQRGKSVETRRPPLPGRPRKAAGVSRPGSRAAWRGSRRGWPDRWYSTP